MMELRWWWDAGNIVRCEASGLGFNYESEFKNSISNLELMKNIIKMEWNSKKYLLLVGIIFRRMLSYSYEVFTETFNYINNQMYLINVYFLYNIYTI